MKHYLYGLLAAVVLHLVFVGACAAQIANLPPNLRRAASNPDQDAYRQVQIQRTMEAQQRVAMRQAEQEARDSAKIREVMPSVSAADPSAKAARVSRPLAAGWSLAHIDV